jgi:hypothetical protein
VELSNGLGAALGLDLPGTLAFDYPSMVRVDQHRSAMLSWPVCCSCVRADATQLCKQHVWCCSASGTLGMRAFLNIPEG